MGGRPVVLLALMSWAYIAQIVRFLTSMSTAEKELYSSVRRCKPSSIAPLDDQL
jgi:hypothetical protein